MNCEDIRLLFEYNHWANERILAAAENLNDDQLKASNDLGWGSLHGMLAHILDAEYGWRRYLSDGENAPWLQADDFTDLAAIRQRWAAENQALEAYLASLSDDALDGKVFYEVDGQERFHILWHCLIHLVNHGTQHRSECAALLTELGCSPGEMDFTVFLNQRQEAASP